MKIEFTKDELNEILRLVKCEKINKWSMYGLHDIEVFESIIKKINENLD